MITDILTALVVVGYVAVVAFYVVGAAVWARQFLRYRRGTGEKPREVSPVGSETLANALAAACGSLVGVLLAGGPASWGWLALLCLACGYAVSWARFLIGWRSGWARSLWYAGLFGFGLLGAASEPAAF